MKRKARVSEAVDYIIKHLDTDIKLEDIAGKAYFSKYHYHKLFRREAGEPLARYVRRKRLENAAKDLVSTSESILDIAVRYCYGSQEAFSRSFKRVFGVSPGQYRRRHSGGNTMATAA